MNGLNEKERIYFGASSNNFNFKQYRILTDLLNSDNEEYGNLSSVISPNKVNFNDLVFTLKKNPEQYLRPVVDLEKYGFMVRGNNIFFKAGKEAGLKSFICDVNLNTIDDKHFSQFQMLEPETREQKYLVHALLFLDVIKKEISQNELMQAIRYYANNSNINTESLELTVYPDNEAVEYKIANTGANSKQESGMEIYKNKMKELKGNSPDYYAEKTQDSQMNHSARKYAEYLNRKINEKETVHSLVSFVQAAARKYGKIRSINGISPYY